MSVVKANSHQIGQSLTASQNFTWYQPSTPDGTVRLGNGNSGSVTDLVTLTSAGNLGIGTSSPVSQLNLNLSTGGDLRLTRTIVGGGNSTLGSISFGNQSASSLSSILATEGGSTTSSILAFYTATGGSSSERMRLDSSGNLGLGVTPSGWGSTFKALQEGAGSLWSYSTSGFGFTANAYNNSGWKYVNNGYANSFETDTGKFIWYTAPSGTAGNAISFTQAMTLDASGNLLVGTTSLGNRSCSIISKGSGFVWEVQQTGGAASSCQGITYSASSPNNSSDYFLYCIDSTAPRANIRSNGGIANYSANNVNLSDERVKTEITPAPSWLAKINAIEVVNFKYKDQTHDDFNLGAIAQQVQSVAPELVDTDGFGETPEDGVPLMAIFETDLKYAMLKAIQELSAELNELKQKVNA